MATGVRTFGQFVLETSNVDRVDEDFSNFIESDDESRWPMAAFLNKKGNSVEKKTTEFTLFAGTLIPRAVTLTVAITTTDASAVVTCSSTDGIVVGTLLHTNGLLDGATAGELLRVTAVTTSITVQRLTTVAGIADNKTCTIIGNSESETSTSGPNAFDMEPASVVGQMTILKRRVDISITERNSAIRGGNSRLQEKLDRAKQDFLLDQEHSAWFSVKTSNVGSNSVKTSMGIHEQLAGATDTVNKDAGSALLTAAVMGDAVSNFAAYAGTSSITLFHGRYGMDSLFQLGQTATVGNQNVSDNKWGFKGGHITAGAFDITCVYSRVFDIVGAPYHAMMFGLDMGLVKNVHLKEGRARLQRNVQSDPSGEKESHQFRAQGGISITWPKKHFFIFDLV